MKSNIITSLILLLNLAFLTNLHAQDFEYTIENDEVTITDYISENPEVTIPSTIEGLPVTAIGERAFYYYNYAENLTIPESVTDIGQAAFARNRFYSITVDEQNPNYLSLDGVLFSKDMSTLIAYPSYKGQSPDTPIKYSWDALDVSYEIPNAVTRIENHAFYYCEYLSTITFSNNLTQIGDQSFYSCYDLTEITLPNSLTHIGEFAFQRCTNVSEIHIPSSVTEIGTGAMATTTGSLSSITVDEQNPNYTSIEGVLLTKDLSTLVAYPAGNERSSYAIPNTVSSLADYSFSSCRSLTEVAIPESVTDLGNHTFLSCYNLLEINLPNGITEIGDGVFEDCVAVRSIFIPNSVTKIGERAFYRCSRDSPVYNPIDRTYEFNEINEISLPTNLTHIGDYAFYEVRTPKITLPQYLTEIGTGAFSNLSLLTRFDVHEQNSNYSSLEGVLFNKNQTTLIQYPIAKAGSVYEVPLTVTTILAGAFSGPSLTEIIIPASVTDIGLIQKLDSYDSIESTFDDLTSLSRIQVNEQNPHFRSFEGVLFSKDMTTLITYPTKKRNTFYKIPDTVTKIADRAFYLSYRYFDSSYLESIIVPSGVTTISSRTFPSISSAIPEITSKPVKNIYFMGDAPEFLTNGVAYGGPTLFYQPNTSGWDNIETPYGELQNQVIMYSPDHSQLINISTRARVGTKENITIGGFTIKGEDPMLTLIQGVGEELIDEETLTSNNVLSNPSITVFDISRQELASNSDWNTARGVSTAQREFGSYVLDSDSKSEALIQEFTSGGYTVHLSGEEGAQGISLLEIYRFTAFKSSDSQLVNISTRGEVIEGNEVVIGGFVIEGGLGKRVLIQGVGQELINPLLTANKTLADPIITLVDAYGDTVSENDNWESDNAAEKAQAMIDAGSYQLTPDSKSAAIVEFLRPGAYTVLLSGVDNTQGIGLFEIYVLDDLL